MDFEEPQIPGYSLYRKIGSGGFGTVYLAKKEGEDGFIALKFIRTQSAKRERRALEKYARFPDKDNWVKILDWGDIGEAIFYTMPLADALIGSDSVPPEDFRWQEASLQKVIDLRRVSPNLPWFSRETILDFIGPIFDAAIALGENGLLHRDIKPGNILFFGGKTKLADFGLLDNDRRTLSRIGTPLYSAPSWFSGSGGNPDVYGLATTLYSLMTGNLPDTIGRAAYRFPEKWRDGASDATQREQWLHWHRCILRSIAENPAERFLTIKDFKNAVFSDNFRSSDFSGAGNAAVSPATQNVFPAKKITVAAFVGMALSALIWGGIEFASSRNETRENTASAIHGNETRGKEAPENKTRENGVSENETYEDAPSKKLREIPKESFRPPLNPELSEKGRLEIKRLPKINLEPGTKNRVLGKGFADAIIAAGRGSRSLEFFDPFKVNSLKLESGGELSLSGKFSCKPVLEMNLSQNEKIRFTKNAGQTGPTEYGLKSIVISGVQDGHPIENIIVDEGVILRVDDVLYYTFHADVTVNGTLIADRINGEYYIDFYGNGTIRVNGIFGRPKGLTMHDGLRVEIGEKGLIRNGRTVLRNVVIAVTKSWKEPATKIDLEGSGHTEFELQAPDGTPTTAEISGTVGNKGRLLKTGAGTLILSGKNTYAGGTEVHAGTLVAGSPTAFGKAESEVSVADGGRIRLGTESKNITLVPCAFSVRLSDAYRETAAIFGNGDLAAGTRIRLSASEAYIAEKDVSGTETLRYRIFASEIPFAGTARKDDFTLDENLARHWRISDYSDGVLTLSRENSGRTE